MKNYIICSIVSIILCSCINEYKLPTEFSEEFEPEIVIQGRILAGEESVIYVSYTSQFNQETITPVVRDAEVFIVGSNGYKSPVAEYEPENNCFVADTRTISRNEQYAVEVKLDGETYQSEYLTILDTPEIDEITYKEHNDTIYNGISIHVTTLADKKDSRHYMWSYEEDWEFHSEIDITRTPHEVPIYDERWYPLENPNVNPYYYCWMRAVSRNVHLYSTNELTENKVKDVKLTEIPIDDIRISYIYSILVKQWSLSDGLLLGGIAPATEPALQLLKAGRRNEDQGGVGIVALDLEGAVGLDVQDHVLVTLELRLGGAVEIVVMGVVLQHFPVLDHLLEALLGHEEVVDAVLLAGAGGTGGAGDGEPQILPGLHDPLQSGALADAGCAGENEDLTQVSSSSYLRSCSVLRWPMTSGVMADRITWSVSISSTEAVLRPKLASMSICRSRASWITRLMGAESGLTTARSRFAATRLPNPMLMSFICYL